MANREGTVIQVVGPVLDIRFDDGCLPELLAAIEIKNGVAEIDPRICIGCGVCTRTCPSHVIHLMADTSRVALKCSSHAKGADTRRACTNGCIACGKCEKNCPHDAIHVVNNLATIDYEKCTGCGKCAEVCPVKCIEEGSFICGARKV